MFPLKQRRKYARLEKQKIEATIFYKDVEIKAIIKDLSGGGCKLKLKNKQDYIPDNEHVTIKFDFKEESFNCKATHVKVNTFEFIFDNEECQSKLNLLIVKEYLKDTPELINEKYIK